MNARHAFRRFASLAFVLALFTLTASSAFAHPSGPGDPSEDIIVIGG